MAHEQLAEIRLGARRALVTTQEALVAAVRIHERTAARWTALGFAMEAQVETEWAAASRRRLEVIEARLAELDARLRVLAGGARR